MLADGTYDVFVVDARVEGEGPERTAHLSLTILAGDSKGEVVDVAARGLPGDELDLLGLPGTLVVDGGVPRVTLEP